MKRIVKFQTSDGREHLTEDAAKTHEITQDAAKELREILTVSLSTGRAESVINQILAESDEIRDVLKRMKQRLPRPKREAKTEKIA